MKVKRIYSKALAAESYFLGQPWTNGCLHALSLSYSFFLGFPVGGDWGLGHCSAPLYLFGASLSVSFPVITRLQEKENSVSIASQPQEQDFKLKSRVTQCVYVHFPLPKGEEIRRILNLPFNATICDLFFRGWNTNNGENVEMPEKNFGFYGSFILLDDYKQNHRNILYHDWIKKKESSMSAWCSMSLLSLEYWFFIISTFKHFQDLLQPPLSFHLSSEINK